MELVKIFKWIRDINVKIKKHGVKEGSGTFVFGPCVTTDNSFNHKTE